MSPGLQILAKFLVVVEFAVVDDPEVLVFIADGLMAGLNVDDAQPPHGETDIPFNQETLIIRAAMDDSLIHFCQHVPLDPPSSILIKNSADSAHN
jgi:hypothetical protein